MKSFAHTRVALGLLVLVGMAALAGCQPGVPDTVKIGVAQPLSGPLKDLGQDMIDGTQMAIDDINKEGLKVDGKLVKLELVTADDKADAEAGKAAAKQLIDAGVIAVIGHLNSGVSIAAAPVYAEKMIPQLAISTKPEYTKLNLPTTLRLVASDALQSKAMGSIANGLPGEHVYAVVDDSTPYGKSLAENALAQLKGKTIGVRASLDDKTTDFKALVAQLLEKKVDVFVTTLADFQVVALADQLVAAGVKNMNIIGSDTIKTEGMLKVNQAVGTIYATSPIIGAGEFTGGKPFLEKFRARFKHDPIYAAHYAYDAVYVLSAAIKQAKSVDGNKLVPALKSVDALAPVTSSMRFAADGEQRYGSVSVYQLNRGNWFLLTRSDVW
ncbi:MAG TPA: branched-chain amino acid ABC transporter substrate-binding protein [Ideonella sp.]|jgi:branched-chain amino acid transport system substrate-binding protein|nr:branched-chain amino acid ABC transporter substrate-binding protein [Ideonella sp.]